MATNLFNRCFSGMASGNLVDLANVTAAEIVPADMIYGLSRIDRFNGQTLGPLWTVGDHLVLGDRLLGKLYPEVCRADPLLRMAFLLHDAHEYLVGDIPEPVKRVLATLGIRDEFDRFIAGLDVAIYTRFGLPFARIESAPYVRTRWDSIVRDVDYKCYLIESAHLRLPPDMRRFSNPEDAPEHRVHQDPGQWLNMVPFPRPLDNSGARHSRFRNHVCGVLTYSGSAVQVERQTREPDRGPPVLVT